MADETINSGLAGRVAVVTGGGGVLGGSMAEHLARQGVKVALLGRTVSRLETVAARIRAAGGEAAAVAADVLDPAALETARAEVAERLGRPAILLNAAGGNMPGATIMPEQTFFDLQIDDFDRVVSLNLRGTVLPTQVFGPDLVATGHGCVVNVSSMAARRPLTRVVGYAAAKAAVDNFTCWLAVEAAKKFGSRMRVNAIQPGFFVTEQNRRLLTEEDGSPTPRGRSVLDHTPLGRFGNPEDLHTALDFLCSDASSFVTGVVVPVDGGFGAFSGV